MITASNILTEIKTQEKGIIQGTSKGLVDELSKELELTDSAEVDILNYVRAEWGLNERPYPIQRFIIKILYALPLDDRYDDEILEIVDEKTFKPHRLDQFDEETVLDIGPNLALRVKETDSVHGTVTLETKPRVPLQEGEQIRTRITIWDKFREKMEGAYTEKEFLEFLYGDGPGTDNCRFNWSLAEYEERVRQKRIINLVVLRIGRRGTKTTISQWVAAYEAYKLMKKYNPQEYYRTRRDQAISMTLIATGKEQAQDLLAPARSAMKRSPFLRRYVAADSERRITLNTPYNMDNGLDAENGVKVIAAPCSAKSVRGPANIMALLEEYGTFYWELTGSDKSDKEIYNAISPSLADLKDPKTGMPAGRMLIISTPLTREAHMYELESQIWEASTDPSSDLRNGMVIHLPSFWTNRLLSTEYLKQEYQLDALAFRQEFEAYYTDQRQQAVTRHQIEMLRKDPSPTDQTILPGETLFMGFDLGLKNDPTSITIVAADPTAYCRLVYHEKISREGNPEYRRDDDPEVLDIIKIAERVDYLWKAWGVQKGLADQWNAAGLVSHLKSTAKNHLEMAEINMTSNDRIAKNFLAAVQQHRFEIYAPEEDWSEKQSLIRELVRLQRLESGGLQRRVKLEAPNLKGMHDDQYSSLSRALYVANRTLEDRPAAISSVGNQYGKVMSDQQKKRLETLRRQKEYAANNGRSVTRGQRRR